MLSFTVFPTTGSVIASGLKGREEIPLVLAEFALEVSGLRGEGEATAAARRWRRRVVNSTYAGAVHCRCRGVSTCRVVSRARDSSESIKPAVRISLRSQFFPGSLLRWSDHPGTVNVFNNGKYVIVGAASRRQVAEVHRRLCALISAWWTTFTPPMSCAWSAGWSSTG